MFISEEGKDKFGLRGGRKGGNDNNGSGMCEVRIIGSELVM